MAHGPLASIAMRANPRASPLRYALASFLFRHASSGVTEPANRGKRPIICGRSVCWQSTFPVSHCLFSRNYLSGTTDEARHRAARSTGLARSATPHHCWWWYALAPRSSSAA